MEAPGDDVSPANRNFRAIVIGGYKVCEDELQEDAWSLCKILFDYSERRRKDKYGEVQIIVNKSNRLKEVNEDNVHVLHKWIFDNDEEHKHPSDKEISMCIFAHSHGAKIAKDALADYKLRDFLRKRNPTAKDEAADTEAIATIERIRRNLAVFTFGGIENVPTNMGKVVRNVRFSNDARSFFGEMIYAQKDEKDSKFEAVTIKVATGAEDDIENQSNRYEAKSVLFRGTSSLFSLHKFHAFSDYVGSNRVMKFVENCLEDPEYGKFSDGKKKQNPCGASDVPIPQTRWSFFDCFS